MKVCATLLFFFPFLMYTHSTWHNNTCLRRKSITGLYARGGSTLSDFPVLISITNDSSLSNHAKQNGDDICFYASNTGSMLKHEVEYYTNGNLITWVKIPSLTSDVSENVIYMYYGCAGSTSMQDPQSVWDTNYIGIWHMHAISGAQQIDSTANTNHGSPMGGSSTVPGIRSSKVGSGAYFSNAFNHRYDCGSNESVNISGNLTAECWMSNASATFSAGTIRAMMGKFNTGTGGFAFRQTGTSPYAYNFWANTVHSLTTNLSTEWMHIAATYNGSHVKFFINGAEVLNSVRTGVILTSTASLKIGNYQDSAGYSFDGILDEVRLSKTARGAGWILTSFSNQLSPEFFFDIGLPESGPPQFSIYPETKPALVQLTYSNMALDFYYSITNSVFIFGDGCAVTNSGTNALASVQKAYSSPGTYTNWLVIGTTKPEEKSNSTVITIVPYTPATVDFVLIGEPITGHKVVFLDTSVCTLAPITNWKIDFGDGNSYSLRCRMSTYTAPHYYGSSGEYRAVLTIVDANGVSFSTNKTIMVTDFGARKLGNLKKNIYKLDIDFPLAFTYRFKENEEKCYVRIVALNGRLINEYLYEGSNGIDALFRWNGRDSRGYIVTSGVYFLRVQIIGDGKRIDEFYEYLLLY